MQLKAVREVFVLSIGGIDLHFLSLQVDTSLHCQTMDSLQGRLVHSAILIVPTDGGMARLS